MSTLNVGSRDRRRIRRNLLRTQGEYCAICFVTFDASALTVDHIKPRSKGGSNRLSNLRLTCRPCNERKADSYAAG